MIGINAKAAFHTPRTGIEEYAFELIRHLGYEMETRQTRRDIFFYAPSFPHVAFPNLEGFPRLDFRVLRSRRLWTQGRLALEFFLDTPDIFFNPEQILPRFAPKKSVITVHDLAYEIYPEFYPLLHQQYLHFVTRRAVKKAKYVIAVSERTKRDITKYYGIPQNNIKVIYHGFLTQHDMQKQDTSKEIDPLTVLPTKLPYVFFIGRIELKKNLSMLISAFEIFARMAKIPVALILAGKDGHGASIIRHRAFLSPYRDNIFFLDYVHKTLKPILYRNARVFAFPSLYEGFGLPILEAQSFGVPVVAANTSSLPEVLGEGGLLTDSHNDKDLAQKMLTLFTNEKLRKFYIKKGFANLNRFSWEKTASQTLELLLNL